jgi:histidinol-phosphatase (PHP family)
MCRQALKLGLQEIAITEHAEWHSSYPAQGLPLISDYFAAIEQCRAQFGPLGLTVHAGVELGNPHDYRMEASTLLAQYPFDVVLASLHWLYGKNVHLEEAFANNDPYRVYTDYFVELGQMVLNFDFDILAHFDRIIHRGTLMGIRFNPYPLEPIIRDTLAIIARYGRVLELNTTFLNHSPDWNDALVTMLQWYLQEGGTKVVVSSDAHRIAEIGRHFDIAVDILTRAGFNLPTQLFRVTPSVREIMPAAAVATYWNSYP